MNRLETADRARIIHLLCEGQSIRAITRLTGASKITVSKLLCDAGKACAAYHDKHVRNLKSKRIQLDEIWAFVYAIPCLRHDPKSFGVDDAEIVGDGAAEFAPSLGHVLA
jgi:hypothetical protein